MAFLILFAASSVLIMTSLIIQKEFFIVFMIFLSQTVLVLVANQFDIIKINFIEKQNFKKSAAAFFYTLFFISLLIQIKNWMPTGRWQDATTLTLWTYDDILSLLGLFGLLVALVTRLLTKKTVLE